MDLCEGIPGWKIDTEAVMLALPEQKLQGLLHLLAIPDTQHRIFRIELEFLVVNLQSMHLSVPESVAHL